MKWRIFHKNDTHSCDAVELTYSGEWMGEEFLTVSAKSPEPVAFAIDDYIDYRGQRYYLKTLPDITKQARRRSIGDAFIYENIRFDSPSAELKNFEFRDIVLFDNGMYTMMPDFTFWCETVCDYADRLKANLDNSSEYTWTVKVKLSTGRNNYYEAGVGGRRDDALGERGVQVSINSQTLWDSLSIVQDTFKLVYTIKGRTITIGDEGDEIIHTFKYGKKTGAEENGLFKLERNLQNGGDIVTVIRAMGNSTNMPSHYYQAVKIYGETKYLTNLSYDTYCEYSGKEDLAEFFSDTDIWGFPKNASRLFSWDSIIDYPGMYQSGTLFFLKGVKQRQFSLNLGGNRIVDTTIIVNGIEYNAKVWFYANSYVQSMYGVFVFLNEYNARLIGDWILNHNTFRFKDIINSEWDVKTVDIAGFPNNLNVKNLMLPSFMKRDDNGVLVTDPVLVSDSVETYGRIEKTIIFDGSDDTEDIYPTIKGSGYDTPTDVDRITDDGYFGQSYDNFNIWVSKEIADDLNNRIKNGSSPEISFTDGMCGGRSFKIDDCELDGNEWKLSVQRDPDNAIERYFPYNDANISTSDHFVLIGIEFPEQYIEDAAKRLELAAIKWLSEHCTPIYAYSVYIEPHAMMRDYRAKNTNSLYYKMYAGDIFTLEDTDIVNNSGNRISLNIDKLEINEGESRIPQYTVTLREAKVLGTWQKMQRNMRMGGESNVVDYTPTVSIYNSDGSVTRTRGGNIDLELGDFVTYEQLVNYVDGGEGGLKINRELTKDEYFALLEEGKAEPNTLYLFKKVVNNPTE